MNRIKQLCLIFSAIFISSCAYLKEIAAQHTSSGTLNVQNALGVPVCQIVMKNPAHKHWDSKTNNMRSNTLWPGEMAEVDIPFIGDISADPSPAQDGYTWSMEIYGCRDFMGRNEPSGVLILELKNLGSKDKKRTISIH